MRAGTAFAESFDSAARDCQRTDPTAATYHRVSDNSDTELDVLLMARETDDLGMHVGSLQADLLQADVPASPVEGDTLTIAAVAYRIDAVTTDPIGVFWRCDLDRVP